MFSLHLESQIDTTDWIIRKLASKYHTDKLLSYEFSIEQYDSTGKIILNATKGKMAKSKTLLHMTYNDTEIVLHDSLMLYVEDARKEILLKKLSKSEFDSMSNYTIEKYLLGLKSQKIKIKKIQKDNDNTLYTMIFNNMPENLYTFSIDNNSGYINEIRIDYYMGNELNIIENRVMNLKYYNYTILNHTNYNPESKYIRFFNNKYELVEAYKNYQLKSM
jgi:hypothetical protein